jgi:hypothetical protein
MKKSNRRFLLSFVGGILLIAAGVIFLLANLEMVTISWEVVIGPMLAGGGLVFLLVFITDTDEWWALIPGFILIGVGINIFMGQWLDTINSGIGGAIFLGFVGLPFIVIYISNHQHWWAIIPGGVLLTMAAVSLVPDTTSLEGGLFFLGLAVTFGLVYILPKPSGRLKWALYPAGILLLMGVLMILGAANLLGFVGPLALLVIGGYVIFRAIRK